MPWLQGLGATASSEAVVPGVLDRMEPSPDCDEPCFDYGGMELVADVTTRPGSETILVSFTRGIVVLDEQGRVLARRPGFQPRGSADELLAVAVGDAQLDTPVIAVAVKTGGRREHEVRLELYRLARDGKLDVLFSGVVEEHAGERHAVGNVTFVAGAIRYTAPASASPELRPQGALTQPERGPATRPPRAHRSP